MQDTICIVMKASSTLILKLVVVLIGFVVLGLCVFVLPAGLMSDKTGLYKPILLGMYLPAIPFFIALFQVLKLLGLIDKNQAFSDLSVRSLKIIKYCGIAIGAIYTAGMPFIYIAAEKDDAPGVIVIGLVIIFAAFVVSTFVAVLEKLMKSAIDLKSENDLTI